MIWTVEQLIDLATGYWKSAALSAAVQLRVFEGIGEAEVGAGELAGKLAASEAHLRVLLDALAGMELLEKREGRYRICPGTVHLLDPQSPQCMLEALAYNADLYPLWGRLAESVREGRPVAPPQAHLGRDPQRTERFVRGMHSRANALAGPMLEALDLSGCERLLDVGAGPGTIGNLLAERHPKLRVTLFDLPEIIAIAKELQAGRAGQERLTYMAGDYHRDALPGGFDAVLYSGALHQEAPEQVRPLLARMRESLREGGRIFIIDLMMEDGRERPVFSALFGISMMLTTPTARIYTGREVREMLAETGFCDVELIRPARSPYWIVTARRG